jgi:PAS domain S-box-containing protein
MTARITDKSVAAKTDFSIRKHPLSISVLLLLFVTALGFAFVSSLAIQKYPGLWGFGVLALIIGCLTAYTVYFTRRSQDMVLATEFQNALFASAAGLNTQFCLIVKRDGSIVYFDPGFQKIFPKFASLELRAIDALLERGGVSQEEQRKIFDAMEKGSFEKVVFPLNTDSGETIQLIMTIDPLPRPSGFFLLRARNYVPQRNETATTGAAMVSPLFPQGKAPTELFSSLLHQLPVALYTADMDGRLQYTNYALEAWLGYNDGEMLGRGATLQNVIYQIDNKPIGTIELSDFSGEVLLQHKNSSLVKAHMTQQLHRDGAGNLIGCSASLMPLGDDADGDTLKKKLNQL